MEISTRGGKITISPSMSSALEKVIRDDDMVVEASGELEDKMVKDVRVPQKVTPMSRPLPPFPKRLVKKMKDGNYKHFITMLKQHSIKVPLV